jgi:beta-lactamase regulating signal transducer with metallopeptidase domain/DUF4097 and DUF4098 domain-containing protein YvlB
MTRAIIASTIALGLAGLLATLARRASASVRHAIWLVGLVTALGVGALAAIGPVLEVESSFATGRPLAPLATNLTESLRSTADLASIAAPAVDLAVGNAPAFRLRPDVVLLAIWATGVAFILGRAIAAHVGAARLVARSSHLDVDRRLEVDASIDVFLSPDVDAPFTLGARRPVILLPLEAVDWTAERLRIVLVHEAAHVARLDYVAQLVATAACAIYWFNPIAWLAATRLRAEAEHAADDRVLAAGVDGVTYASHLLELARPESAPLSTAMAVGMARGTTRLEKRFTAMLDSTRSRGIVPLRLQAALGSVALMAAIPFTSLRLVPVTASPEKIAPVAEAVSNAIAPVEHKAAAAPAPRLAKVQSATRSSRMADTVIDRTIAAASGESITIELRPSGGGVTVHAWDRPEVRMHAELSGTYARQTRVTLERSGRGIALVATHESQRYGNSTSSNSYELWVPRKFDVSIESTGGEIIIQGVEGRFSGRTGGGEITLQNVKGEASLTTGGGEVHVMNSSLDGYVSTGGGEATVTSTTGNVRVTSGSGPVIRDGVGGQTRVYGIGGLDPQTTISNRPLIVIDGVVQKGGGGTSYTRAGGDIRLESIPNGGSFTTGGGDIVIGAVGGTASFTTGGGSITLDKVEDDVSATTGAGDVQVTVTGAGARNVHVTSGSGRVVIEVPAGLDARFDLETAYTENRSPTKITSDFPVNVTQTDEWDYRNGSPRRFVRATGTAGAGRAVIKVRTVNGDIVIRRR